MSDSFDLVVLGAGSGGYACALRAAQLGLRVALVEKDKLGGTCLHRGCIPTKALLHAAEVADTVRESGRVGVRAHLEGVDLAAMRAFADGVVERLFKGLTGLVAARTIELVSGSGRLVRTLRGVGVQVPGRLIEAKYVVLATGSEPRTLPGIEVDGERVLTSEHALRLEQLPASAVVLGGGVIGVELASAWRSLGAEVTIVEALDRLVPSEEPALSSALTRAFKGRGIAVRAGARVSGVERTDTGVRLNLETGEPVEADVVLVAVGRGPVTSGMGFEEIGVRLERGFIVTDERLRTSVPGVYAVGDIVPGLQLAHRGFAHGLFVGDEIGHLAGVLDRAPAPVRDRDVPRVTYSDPEIASVGLTEEQARAEGEVEAIEYNLAGNGRSQIRGTAGLVKVVRLKDGPIVGVHAVGAGVSELVGEAQLMTAWEAFPDDVAPLVHAHPTQDEALGEACLALAGRPLHVHG